MLIEETLLGRIDKEKLAIDRTKEFQNRNQNNKNILAFSGGKDSVATYIILVKSGIDFIPIYSPTSVDPPELINYIRKDFTDWTKKNKYPKVQFAKYNINEKYGKYKEVTMWNLLRHRGLPPTRRMRYCCEELKERTGNIGDTVYTGVRWEESSKRSKQSMVGFWKQKIMVRPIIDFSEDDVWELIKKYNVPYCELYNQGWKRIGCIGCPLSKNMERELNLYPKYKENYIKSFNRMVEYREEKGLETKWKNGQEVYDWWIGKNKKDTNIEGQCSMF